MESSIVYGSAKIKAAPTFKCATKSDQQLQDFLLFFALFFPFIFAAKAPITVGRLFKDKQLRVVWFCRLPLSKLEDWAQSVFNRLATPPPPPSVMRKFFGWTTRIECNIFISFEFSGKRELAFIYPYFELIFAKQEWGALLYSILYFINNRQQRWAKLQSIVFSQGSLKQ